MHVISGSSCQKLFAHTLNYAFPFIMHWKSTNAQLLHSDSVAISRLKSSLFVQLYQQCAVAQPPSLSSSPSSLSVSHAHFLSSSLHSFLTLFPQIFFIIITWRAVVEPEGSPGWHWTSLYVLLPDFIHCHWQVDANWHLITPRKKRVTRVTVTAMADLKQKHNFNFYESRVAV